jgi:hypothetical protein
VTRRRDLAAWALCGLAGLAALALLHFWTPLEGREHAVCFTRRVLGIPCPACGLTRAFAHLAKGEWAAALAAHPLAPALAAEAALLWMVQGAALVRRRPLRSPVPLHAAVYAHLAVLGALWLGRLATGTLPW